jgi:hypothetical protein
MRATARDDAMQRMMVWSRKAVERSEKITMRALSRWRRA